MIRKKRTQQILPKRKTPRSLRDARREGRRTRSWISVFDPHFHAWARTRRSPDLPQDALLPRQGQDRLAAPEAALKAEAEIDQPGAYDPLNPEAKSVFSLRNVPSSPDFIPRSFTGKTRIRQPSPVHERCRHRARVQRRIRVQSRTPCSLDPNEAHAST